MKLLLRSKDLDHFYLPWQRLNHIYEDHAKQYDDGATQKDCATRFIFPNRPLMQSYNILRKKDGLALLFLPKKENCFGRKRYPISNRQSILLLQPWPIFGKNIQTIASKVSSPAKASVYKGYKRDKIEMRGDRAEMSDFPLYLNTVAGGLDCRNQAIGGFSFVVKIYALPVVEIIGQFLYLLGRYGFDAQIGYCF